MSRRLRTGVSGLVAPHAGVTPAQAENFRALYLEAAWWGLALGLYQSYLSVFATRLGASNFWIGMLSAGPALVNIFWLIPAARVVSRQQRQMPLINWSGFVWRLFILFQLLASWLVLTHPGEALVLLVVAEAIPGGLINLAYTAALPDAVGLRMIGPVTSMRDAIRSVCKTAGTLISIPILARVAFPLNYQVSFALAFATSQLGTLAMSRMRLPDRLPVPRRAAASPWASLSRKVVAAAWREQPAYSWFLVAAVVFHWGMYMGIPLFPIVWVRELQLSDAWIGTMSTVFNLAGIGAALAAPRLLAAWGSAGLLVVSGVALCLYPLGTALARSPLPLLPISVLGGVFSSLLNIGLFSRLIETAPADNRVGHAGLYNAVINVAIFAAPMASTTLASRWGLAPVLFAATGVRIVGGLLFGLSRGGAPADEAPAGPGADGEESPATIGSRAAEGATQ
ncbi:MAG: MFS transporter [Chloroflexi bacterium]|nr:MFS transporter [Chloroflexota bacterium]